MTQDAESRPKIGVVLSGGGADGAYGVGVLKALFNGMSPASRPAAEAYRERDPSGVFPALQPRVFTGTSIGSFNAAFLVSRWRHLGTSSISELESFWLDRFSQGTHGNGGYRVRFNPADLADPRRYLPNPLSPFLDLSGDAANVGWQGVQRLVEFASSRDEALLRRFVELFDFSAFIDPAPWYGSIRREIDFRAIRQPDAPALRVAAVNWETGKLRIFDNSKMSDELGPLAIAASSALPGFYPPAEVGSQPYVDGGVLQNSPLTPAIKAGARELHLVYLDPQIENIALSKLGNTMETLYRMQQIAWASSVNADLAATRRINWHKEVMDEAEQASLPPELVECYDRLKPLTIHRHVPNEDFGGALGLLNLERGRLKRLIDQGFRDAAGHDCEACGCIIAGQSQRRR